MRTLLWVLRSSWLPQLLDAAGVLYNHISLRVEHGRSSAEQGEARQTSRQSKSVQAHSQGWITAVHSASCSGRAASAPASPAALPLERVLDQGMGASLASRRRVGLRVASSGWESPLRSAGRLGKQEPVRKQALRRPGCLLTK